MIDKEAESKPEKEKKDQQEREEAERERKYQQENDEVENIEREANEKALKIAKQLQGLRTPTSQVISMVSKLASSLGIPTLMLSGMNNPIIFYPSQFREV